MPLNDDQLDLIRQSFDVLRGDMRPASTYFYEELFRREPGLRGMFRDDLAGQGMKFMSTLSVIVDTLHRPDELTEQYGELGRLHRAVGVDAAMFEPMREALLATIKEVLGERHTLEVEAAWRVAYDDMAAALIGLGGIPGR